MEFGRFVAYYEDCGYGTIRCLNGGFVVYVNRSVITGIAPDDCPRVGESCGYVIEPDNDFAAPEAASCHIGAIP
jgi:hypothetical protein